MDAAERAVGVGLEPGVDAVDVEGMAALGEEAQGLVLLELVEADGAVGDAHHTLPLPVPAHRHRLDQRLLYAAAAAGVSCAVGRRRGGGVAAGGGAGGGAVLGGDGVVGDEEEGGGEDADDGDDEGGEVGVGGVRCLQEEGGRRRRREGGDGAPPGAVYAADALGAVSGVAIRPCLWIPNRTHSYNQ